MSRWRFRPQAPGFTQSAANIEPGVQVTITINASQTLNRENGRFEIDCPALRKALQR